MIYAMAQAAAPDRFFDGFEDRGRLQAHGLYDRIRQFRSGGDADLAVLVSDLLARADRALQRGPYSVTHKTATPPSGDKRDYMHLAPYYWPNPDTPDGLPYVRRDGRRAPGTMLNGEQSELYDRTRVQNLFDDSYVLCLAWRFKPRPAYLDHAASLLETFFVDPETRMRPHLRYAQIRPGHNRNIGPCSGLIELKDFFYYLDAVRLMASEGALEPPTLAAFNHWLADYLDWLLRSSQGQGEARATNNHGVYYDLQVAAIAAFLGWTDVVEDALRRARRRLPAHFDADGAQPQELDRAETEHYCCFNLQGWINLAELAEQYGEDLWSYEAVNGANLKTAAVWLLDESAGSWGHAQSQPFEAERILPIWAAASERLDPAPKRPARLPRLFHAKPMLSQGVRPFWQI